MAPHRMGRILRISETSSSAPQAKFGDWWAAIWRRRFANAAMRLESRSDFMALKRTDRKRAA